MKKILLGNTGISVSPLCLGCLNFGTKTNRELSFQLLDQYIKSGGNFLDTANNYAFWYKGAEGGESESLIGDWMEERKNRKDLILATKIGAKPKTKGSGFENTEGLSKKAIINAVEKSLKRLKTDYIDLLYVHIDDKLTPLEETLSTLNQLIQSGKILRIGCSNYTFERFIMANEICQLNDFEKYCCIQMRYSYFQPDKNSDFGIQECADSNLLSYVQQHSYLSLLAYSPTLHGYYNTQMNLKEQYHTTENEKRMDIILKIAKEINASPNQIVLAWLLQNTPRAIPLIAASRSEHLEENMKSLDIILSEHHLNLLANASLNF